MKVCFFILSIPNTVILKIILTDGSYQRFTLSQEIPPSIDDLVAEVKNQHGFKGNFKLQFMDSLFGNEFLNLTSISEVQDKDTLTVIDQSPPQCTLMKIVYSVLSL